MTSTVVDATVFLLCVSASVLALTVADSGHPTPDADSVADTVATTTATASYEATDSERTHHATLAELLTHATRTDDPAYESAVRDAVGAETPHRTQVVAEVENGSRTVAGEDPPRNAEVRTAVVTVPVSDGEAVRIVVRRW